MVAKVHLNHRHMCFKAVLKRKLESEYLNEPYNEIYAVWLPAEVNKYLMLKCTGE